MHRLLVQVDFPDVPAHYPAAAKQFAEAILLGQYRRGRLMAVFAIGGLREESAFLDVACRAEWRGKWATKETLQCLTELLFDVLKLRFVWVQTKNSIALRAALKGGFRFATPADSQHPVLLLTAEVARQRFANQKIKINTIKEQDHGIFISTKTIGTTAATTTATGDHS